MTIKTWSLKISVTGSRPKRRGEQSHDSVQEVCFFFMAVVGGEEKQTMQSRSTEQQKRVVIASQRL